MTLERSSIVVEQKITSPASSTLDRRRVNNISSLIFDTVRQSRKNERTNESRLLSSDRKTTVKSTIARGPTMDR